MEADQYQYYFIVFWHYDCSKKKCFTTSQTGSCCSKMKAYVRLVWIWECLRLQSVLKSSMWNPNKSWSKQVLLPKMVGMVFWVRVWSVVQQQLEVCGSYTSQTQACWTSMTGNESLIQSRLLCVLREPKTDSNFLLRGTKTSYFRISFL